LIGKRCSPPKHQPHLPSSNKKRNNAMKNLLKQTKSFKKLTTQRNKQRGPLQWWQRFAYNQQEQVVSCLNPLQALM
jgi:hypothetical protein